MLETCLFDLGNVLVMFSHDRMCRQLTELFQTDVSYIREALFEQRLQHRFERGHISETEFQSELERRFRTRVNFDDLRRAGADIFQLNEPIVPLLDELREAGHRLVLLSNTCISHYEWIRERFDILDRFDDYVLSFEVGACKPEPLIYQEALKAIACPPDRCFYTDDIQGHIEAAREHGLQAAQFLSVEQLREDLKTHGAELSPVTMS